MPAFLRPRHLGSAFAVLVAVVGLTFIGGCVTHPRARVALDQFPPAQRGRAADNLEVFNAVWDLVNRKHYVPKTDGVDWEEVAARFGARAAGARDEAALYATLNEMLDLLRDSHTHALTPAQATERRTHERARTGFAMVRVDQRWVVTDVVPDSPAARAGVAPGWVVVSRNGEVLDARTDFRPREGEQVHWIFLDENDREVRLTLTAKWLSTAALQVERVLPGGFVYLRFDAFDVADRRWLGGQLRKHRDAPGLVVDLRRNSGGDTLSLAMIVGQFFDHHVNCGTFVTRGGGRRVKTSWQFGSVAYGGPMVVLIDANSASAAEIFAAVMKDHRRAVIIGRKSAGAVLASWFYDLPDGGELQLSREDYLAPNGRRIENNGVEPDVVVTRTVADIRLGRDPDMDAALTILRQQAARPQPPVRHGNNSEVGGRNPPPK